MRTAIVVRVVAGVWLAACAHGSAMFGSRNPAGADDSVESLYWRAVQNLDPANRAGSVDTAVALLDKYLSSSTRLAHPGEANAFRSLVRDAQQLDRVQQALRQARADARTGTGPEQASDAHPNDEMSKEVQRLRDELAAAKAELERIKKRLSNPP
jgi:hypothetical protein